MCLRKGIFFFKLPHLTRQLHVLQLSLGSLNFHGTQVIKNALSGFGRHSKGSGILSPGILLVCVGLNGEIQTARIDATKAYHVLQPAAASEDVGVSPAFFDITAVVELSIFLRPGTGEEAMQTTMPTFVTSVELGQKTSSKQSLGSTLCALSQKSRNTTSSVFFATSSCPSCFAWPWDWRKQLSCQAFGWLPLHPHEVPEPSA